MQLKNRPLVYLPLEVYGRELDAKTLLAVALLSLGVDVLIGHKTVIKEYAKKVKRPGVWYASACRRQEAQWALELGHLGISSVSQDEEAGTIYANYADFYKIRADEWQVKPFRQLFCWGSDDFEYLSKKHPDHSGALALTGSPRASLWGELGRQFYENKLTEIAAENGDYLLVVSGFQYGNGHISPETRRAMGRGDSVWHRNAENSLEFFIQQEHELMEAFRDAIVALARDYKVPILVRPHPCEDKSFWSAIARRTSLVTIQTDGPITPWLLSAKAVLQNSSTVALEASVCGITVIPYGTQAGHFFRQGKLVPDSLGAHATSVDEIFRMYKSDSGPKNYKKEFPGSEVLGKKIANPGTRMAIMKQAESIEYIARGSESYHFASGVREAIFKHRHQDHVAKEDSVQGSLVEMNKRPRIGTLAFEKCIQQAVRVLDVNPPGKLLELASDMWLISPANRLT